MVAPIWGSSVCKVMALLVTSMVEFTSPGVSVAFTLDWVATATMTLSWIEVSNPFAAMLTL